MNNRLITQCGLITVCMLTVLNMLYYNQVFLTLCLLGNILILFYRLLKFIEINFFENPFRNTIKVSNSLDPDHARRSVGLDLGPNCLQRLFADDTSMQRVCTLMCIKFS